MGARTFRFAVPVLALLAAFLPAFLRADPEPAREVTIASPHWEGVQYEFGRAFEAWYRARTGAPIRVRWLDMGGTSQIEKAIDALYKANPASCGIDVLFGGGVDPYLNRKAKGQLDPFRLPDDVLANIPPDISGVPIVDPDFAYYGAALSSFGILGNRKIEERLRLPAVETWEDLARPEFLGWVSSADPRKSGSVHMIYEVILQAYGWEKGWRVIYRTSGNVRSFFDSSSTPTKEVGAGDAAEAVTIDINGLMQQAFLGPGNVRFVIPKGLSVVAPDGIGILRGAPHPDAARAFVTFAMSAPGQALWMKPLGTPGGPVKYPISRMGVWRPYYGEEPAPPLNPFTGTSSLGFAYDGARGSRRWGVVNDLIGQTAIDVHSRLVRAWQAILRLPEGERAPFLARFDAPPVDEAEAFADAQFWRSDKVRAGREMNRWMAEAAARYDAIAADAERIARLASGEKTALSSRPTP